MKRGFKSECESIATAVRAETGLAATAPLDSRHLAAHLCIPLHPLSTLKGKGLAAAVGHVRVNSAVLSAMTIFPEWPLPRRLVIFNDDNSGSAAELRCGARAGACLADSRATLRDRQRRPRL